MNPEVCASIRIMKVINKHINELDGCRHSIVDILKEAFFSTEYNDCNNNSGVRSITSEHQSGTGTTHSNTEVDIDIESKYYIDK